MDFSGKTIWITGASSGIGEAMAVEWASHKPVLILSGRNTEKLEAVKRSCEEKGAVCHVVSIDLTHEETIVAATERVFSLVPAIDVLVNNGGISQRSYAAETPMEVDRTLFETNFFGAVSLTKKVLASMIARQSGHIVVISSMVGKFGFPLRTAYSASKHALQGYFESLRAEVKSYNIRVTIVSPGRIHTRISLNAIDKDGNRHGKMDEAQAKGMSAEQCARKIIRAVRKGKRDILIGRKELLMFYIRRIFPRLYHHMVSKVKAT